MDFPQTCDVAPLHITTWSIYSGLAEIRGKATTQPAVTTTWPVANTAFYVPMYFPFNFLVRRVYWGNGSSVTSTNRDVGLYSSDGVRLFSTGSTVATPVSVLQYVSLGTPYLITPGRYYLAMAVDTTTANRGPFGTTGLSVVVSRYMGILQQATAFALPTSMTGIAVSNAMIPMIGITSTASGF